MELSVHSNTVYSSLDLTIIPDKWIIVGDYGSEKRPFKVTQVSLRIDISSDLQYTPNISVYGHWAQKSGHKWMTKHTRFPNWWSNSAHISYPELPQAIREYIYEQVVASTMELTKNTAASLKELMVNKMFVNRPITERDMEQTFLPTVQTVPIKSKYEDMDVSGWSVARKELGLPRPKIQKKKRVKV